MTQPLALVLYEKLLPGSQIVNRLQDLHYRVQTLNEPKMLVQCAEQTKPMLVLADLESTQENICAALALLKRNPTTKHLPIIGFRGDSASGLDTAAQEAGVALVVSETAVLNHLPQILDQALQVD